MSWSKPEPSFQNARHTYWSSDPETKHYPYKEAPHGTRCGGCSQCAHCLTPEMMATHQHGWWKEEDMKAEFDLPSEDGIEEWIISQETYGRSRTATGGKFSLSSIQVSIFPIYKGEKRDKDWEDEVSVVARAATFIEIMDLYRQYVDEALRREKAKFLR